MSREVESLLLIAWALLDDKQWTKAGAAVTVTAVEQVTDDLVLREPTLPEPAAWEASVPLAAALFGETVAALRSAANVADLGTRVRGKARTWQGPVADLLVSLRAHAADLGISESSPRLVTARTAHELLTKLANEHDDVVLVQVLFEFPTPAEPQALAKSMSSAAAVHTALQGLLWSMIEALRGISPQDPRHVQAAAALTQLSEAASAEELHAALGAALRKAVDTASAILAAAGPVPVPVPVSAAEPVPPSPPLPPVGPAVPGPAGDAGVLPASHVNDVPLDGIEGTFDEAMRQARAALAQHPGRRLNVRWWLE